MLDTVLDARLVEAVHAAVEAADADRADAEPRCRRQRERPHAARGFEPAVLLSLLKRVTNK